MSERKKAELKKGRRSIKFRLDKTLFVLIVIMMIALSGTFQALAYYGAIGSPDTMNPTDYDVQQAERAADNLSRAADELMTHADDPMPSFRMRELSNRARFDADIMRSKIEENKREEEEKRQEEERRQDEERRQYEKRRQEEEQQWIVISGNNALPSIQNGDPFAGDPFASNVPFGDSGNTSKPVLTYEKQLLQEYQELQPRPFYDGKDNPGVCMFCHARLLGKQTTCSKCQERKRTTYYNWKAYERKKAARLEQVKKELTARGYTVR